MNEKRRGRERAAHGLFLAAVVIAVLLAAIVKDDAVRTVLLSFAVALFAVEASQAIWRVAGGEPVRVGVAKIEEMIPEQVAQAVPAYRVVSDAGITAIHRTRGAAAQNNYEKWETAAAGAREIDLIGLTMYSEWLEQEPLRNALRLVAKGGGRVRILVLAPPPDEHEANDLNLQIRLKQPAEKPRILLGQLEAAHRELAALAEDLKDEDFEVQPMRTCYPSGLIIRIDDYMFVAPYLATGEGRDSFAFEVKRGGTLYDAYAQEFAMIWQAEKQAAKTRDSAS